MAFVHSAPIGWHEGEQKMHSLLHVPDQDNPTSPGLSPYGARMLQSAPLLAVGVLDRDGRPWTSLLGGEPGFAKPLGQSFIGLKTLVDRNYDPIINLLQGGEQDGEVSDDSGGGKVVSGLVIDLATRSRVKLSGKMIGGALGRLSSEPNEAEAKAEDGIGEVQIVIKIETSLGNCPKYLNKKQIIPSLPQPKLISDSLPLPEEALRLLAKADLFFISSSNHESNMGTNNRGGSSGFVRVVLNDASGTTLAYPEFSGNRLYQTLGNLQTTPRAGVVFPDFDTGDVLYMTGEAEIVVGQKAAALLPRSNLAVRFRCAAARFVRAGLSFRGKLGDASPYNPPVRYLASEHALFDAQIDSRNVVYAKILEKKLLTPTIARLRFSISDPEAAGRWKPGQYVTLAFEDELGAGYSHMRDDDPRSLNDDYVRTFTVSSSPGGRLPEDEFEITHVRAGLEIPLKGFGGSFTVTQTEGETIPFVAGGIGITPLLAQLPGLNVDYIRLFWTINVRDIGLVIDTFQQCPHLAASTTVFVSGVAHAASNENEDTLETVRLSNAKVLTRRLLASDVQEKHDLGPKWYTCAGTELRKSLLSWLPTKEIIYEDFNY